MDTPILTLLSKMFDQLSRQGAPRYRPENFRLLLPAPVLALLEQEVAGGGGQGAALFSIWLAFPGCFSRMPSLN